MHAVEPSASSWSGYPPDQCGNRDFQTIQLGDRRDASHTFDTTTAAQQPDTSLIRQDQQDAVLAERARMAREIHDVLAGSLGLLGIQLEVLHTVLADLGDVDSALKLLVELKQTAREGLKETHRAVHGLRSELRPLDEELTALVARHREVQHAEVTLTVEAAPQWLAPETALALVRVTGEALVNAAKHAPHQPITVVLRYGSGEVVLRIENPLDHSVSDQRYRTVDGGYGLLGMRERLIPLGGAVTAEVTQGRWVVTARVPG